MVARVLLLQPGLPDVPGVPRACRAGADGFCPQTDAAALDTVVTGYDQDPLEGAHPMRRQDRPLDRRHAERGTPSTEPSRKELVSMILGTFREMPGLSLHMNQAARLFGLRRGTCEVILEDLVAQGKLRRAPDGQFVRGELDRPSLRRWIHRTCLWGRDQTRTLTCLPPDGTCYRCSRYRGYRARRRRRAPRAHRTDA